MKKQLAIASLGGLFVFLLTALTPNPHRFITPPIHYSNEVLLELEIQKLTERGLRVQLLGEVVEATDPVSGQKWQFSTEMLTPREPTYLGLPTLTVDLTTIDTNLYNWRFHYVSSIQLTSGWGFPLPISDFDDNGRVESYGARQTQSDITTRAYELTTNNEWMLRYNYPGQIGIFDKSGDVDNNGLLELYARYGDSLFAFEQPVANSIPTKSKLRHRQWYLNATGIPNQIDFMTASSVPEIVYRGSEPVTSEERLYVVRYDSTLTNLRRVWSVQMPAGCFSEGCPWVIATGDFDGDGRKEFTTSTLAGNVYVFEHVIEDSFAVTWATNLSVAGRAASGDVDGNGITEFFVGGTQAEPDGYIHLRVYAFERTSNNTYQPVFSFNIFPAGIFFVDLYQTADVDGDETPELLLSFAGGIIVIKGAGEHTYELFYYRSVSSLDGISAWNIDSSGAAHLFVSRAIGSQQVISQTDVYSLDSLLVVGVGEESMLPSSVLLLQNYPNPFNPTTNIEFRIATFEFVTLKVFDLLGREVASLVDGRVEAGNHTVTLDASHLSSGIYFYRLTAGKFTDVKKLVLMK